MTPEEVSLVAALKKRVLDARSEDGKAILQIFDDLFYLHFIRGKGWDLDKAFEYLSAYFHVRMEKYPVIFRDLKPSTTPTLQSKMLRVLRNKDASGSVVFVDQVRKWDPQMYTVDDAHRSMILVADETFKTNETVSRKGIVLIFDLGEFTMARAKQLTPFVALKGINILVNNMPVKFRAVHIVNQSYLVNVLVSAVRPFLKKKLRERLHLHQDMKSLHSHISPDILPEWLDGTLSEDVAYDVDLEERIYSREEFYEQFSAMVRKKCGDSNY